jgi:cellulose biosynthesis protein BcsQ
MFRIAVIGYSAESRVSLNRRVQEWVSGCGTENEYLPIIDLKMWAPEELKFQASPDLVLFADDCIQGQGEEIFKLIKKHTAATFFAYHNTPPSYAHLEYLARFGVREVLGPSTTADDFRRKVILLAAKASSSRSGLLLLVEGAKGGAGVTSTVASLASAGLALGLKVVVVDLDFSSQDLSRFIYSRPFINEHLAQMLRLNKPVMLESVLGAISYAWEESQSFSCLSPVDASLFGQLAPETLVEIYFRVIQVLDQEFDLIIVDAGNTSGNFIRMFRRIADQILILFSMEAADLYSSVQLLRDLNYDQHLNQIIRCAFLGKDAKARQRLASLVGEVSRAAGLSSAVWMDDFIAKREHYSDWPLTGKTIFQRAALAQRQVYFRIINSLSSEAKIDSRTNMMRQFEKSIYEFGAITRKLLKLDRVGKNFQASKANHSSEVTISAPD